MKKCYFFSPKPIVPFFCLLAAALLLFLSRQPVLAQAFNLVPDEVEYQALADFYNSTNGEGWKNNTNWLKGASHTDFAAWYGVVVVNGDVAQIRLFGNNLTGPLPASLDKLARLAYLELQSNKISGKLPDCLVNMPELISINLPNNQLTGTIPEGLVKLKKLSNLSLSINRLTGPIPERIGELTNLTSLYLYANQLTGTIPGSIGKLTKLVGFNILGNQLTGTIPADITNLTQLRFLLLSNNKLTGTIPSNLDALRELRVLDLSSNQLSGSLPESIGKLSHLTSTRLHRNQLTGTLPESYSGLQHSRDLLLGYNQLTGSIPDSWGKLAAVEQLVLADNQLSGAVPASLASLPKLTSLLLYDNKFTLFPDFKSMFPRATVLVYNNHLGFASIEPNFDGPNQYPAKRFYYYNQRALLPVNKRETGTDTIQFNKGGSVEMWVQDDAPHNVYRWQKLSQLGRWEDIAGATARRYVIPNALASATGSYQCLVSNSWVTNMKLTSHLVVVEALSFRAPGKLAPNLPREAAAVGVVGNKAPPAGTATAESMNYVRTYTPRVAITSQEQVLKGSVDSVQVSTTYIDGLGRPVQTVIRQESPLRRDVIQPIAYDVFGRQAKDYLPYTTEPTKAGDYRPDALLEQYRFYTQPTPFTNGLPKTDYPFSEKAFEASPLNRVLQQAAPGESWQLNSGHAIAFAERTNTAADSVWLWTVAPAMDTTLTATSIYEPGQLWVNQVTDEHGTRTLEFKDKEGRVVLKQAEQGKDVFISTYYVYDDLGNLRYVLPPQAVALLKKNKWTVSESVLDYAFRYHYDHRKRLILKKVLGAGKVYYVYDKLDRVVLSQDGNQRPKGEWSFTKYDVFSRPVLTGLYASADSSTNYRHFQKLLDQQTVNYESPSADNTNHFYTNQAFPVLSPSNSQVLTVSYYDSYDFNQDGSRDVAFDSVSHAFKERPFYRVKGQLTGSKTRVLGTDGWLWSISFYDDKYRVLQSQTDNHLEGKDVLTNRYDFSGKVLETKLVHQKPGRADVPVAQKFAYDHAGRLLEIRQSTGQEPEEVIAKQSYNELGQLQSKQLGNSLQQLDYSYNIRGWLTGINDAGLSNKKDLFGLELSYDRGFDMIEALTKNTSTATSRASGGKAMGIMSREPTATTTTASIESGRQISGLWNR